MNLDFTPTERHEVQGFVTTLADKFKDDPELNRFGKDIFRTMTDENFKINLKSLAETLDYTGFSTDSFTKKFWSLGRNIVTDKTWIIYIDAAKKDKELIKINSKDINSYLVLHIISFVMRGTSVKKAFKRMQKQWIERLDFIFTTYNTKTSAQGSNMMSRIASCFPQIVCYFPMRGIGKTYVDASPIERIESKC